MKKSSLKDNTKIEANKSDGIRLSGRIQSEGTTEIVVAMYKKEEKYDHISHVALKPGKLTIQGILEYPVSFGFRISGDSSLEGNIVIEDGVLDNSKLIGKVEIKNYSEISDSSIEGESSIGAIVTLTRIKKSKIVDSKILESEIERSVVRNSTVCLSMTKDSELSDKVFRGDPVKFYDGDAEYYFSEQNIFSERCELVKNPNYKEKPKGEEAHAVDSTKKV